MNVLQIFEISFYWINPQTQEDNGLFKDYTIQSLLDKLDVIECFENPGHDLSIGEVLKKQKLIYDAMGVETPA